MNKFSSLSFVMTKYQFNILLLTLEKLDIKKSDVVLIVSTKAKKQGVKGLGFKKVIFYEEANESIKNWFNLKFNILKIVKNIGPINKIFLRNYNATISRVILSSYPNAKFYLIEEGTPSYVLNNNFLLLPNSYKEKIKTLVTRLYFSEGKLRVLPFYYKTAIKAGLFSSMKPSLDIPYLKIGLTSAILDNSNSENEFFDFSKYDIVLIDQPLQQVGLSFDDYKNMYYEVLKYLEEKGYSFEKILLIKHPSSDINILHDILNDLNCENVKIYNGKQNIETLLLLNKFKNIKLFIGFFSWSLALLYNYNKKENVNILSTASKKLLKIKKDDYLLMKNIGIKVKEF